MTPMVTIKTKILSPYAVVPMFATWGAAGADLYSTADVVVGPMCVAGIPTGLAFEIPPGYEMQIRSRSGMVAKRWLSVANGVGTIDSDYRGEVWVLIYNASATAKGIAKGERIAQAVIAAVPQVSYQVVEELVGTERGEGGFGSTGK